MPRKINAARFEGPTCHRWQRRRTINEVVKRCFLTENVLQAPNANCPQVPGDMAYLAKHGINSFKFFMAYKVRYSGC